MRRSWNEDCFSKGAASAARIVILRLFGITRHGLLAMTVSVTALWSCIAMEKAALHRGAMDARACASALERLRERPVPVSAPIRFHRQRPKMS
jgi:hypothetical protein